MKVYFKNTHETYCCSLRLLKDTFKDTDIHISYGYFSRKHSTNIYCREHFFCKKNIRGVVVLSLIMVNGMDTPLLSLYTIDSKKNNIPKIQEEFNSNIIDKVREFYIEHLNSIRDSFHYILLVDLFEGHLFIRKGKI